MNPTRILVLGAGELGTSMIRHLTRRASEHPGVSLTVLPCRLLATMSGYQGHNDYNDGGYGHHQENTDSYYHDDQQQYYDHNGYDAHAGHNGEGYYDEA